MRLSANQPTTEQRLKQGLAGLTDRVPGWRTGDCLNVAVAIQEVFGGKLAVYWQGTRVAHVTVAEIPGLPDWQDVDASGDALAMEHWEAGEVGEMSVEEIVDDGVPLDRSRVAEIKAIIVDNLRKADDE